jgi:hypothetical protein
VKDVRFIGEVMNTKSTSESELKWASEMFPRSLDPLAYIDGCDTSPRSSDFSYFDGCEKWLDESRNSLLVQQQMPSM